jgi:hypothetical protein
MDREHSFGQWEPAEERSRLRERRLREGRDKGGRSADIKEYYK